MDEDKIKVILRDQQAFEAERLVWEGHWRQVLRRVLPRQDDFGGSAPGARRTEYIFDSTAPLALDKFAAAMEGMLAPRAETWHRLTTTNTDLNRVQSVRLYLEDVNRILFAERYKPHANFASQFHETMMSLGSIGTGALFVHDIPAKGLGYKSIHMSEIFVAENQYGMIDRVNRKFDFTHRQAVQKWGLDKLPEKLRKAYEKNPFDKSTYLHVVGPNEDRDPDRLDHRGMNFSSTIISMECKAELEVGGYHTMPIPVSRYLTAPREIYGRSPAMQALPDIKMINELMKTILRAVHKAVDPPLLVSDDGVLGRMQTKPGGINVGGMDRRGNELVKAFGTQARLDWAIELLERSTKTINDAFMVSLFQILVDSPDRMTATEVLERMREKGVLLAPAMGRQETELLGPCIEREIDILARQGKLPEMPGEMVEAAGEYQTVYENPLSRAQRAQQATGFNNWVIAMTPIAQTKPEVFDSVDMVEASRGMAEVLGVPERWMKSKETIAAENEERTQAAQVKQLADALPGAGKAAESFAKADTITAQAA